MKFSSSFIFLLKKNFIQILWVLSNFMLFSQEEEWWHDTTETESHAADRGQGGGCVYVCHLINFLGVSTISDDITWIISIL